MNNYEEIRYLNNNIRSANIFIKKFKNDFNENYNNVINYILYNVINNKLITNEKIAIIDTLLFILKEFAKDINIDKRGSDNTDNIYLEF